jgi:hypothetical protein
VRQLSPQALQPQAAVAVAVAVEADLHLPIDKEHIASFRGPGGFSRPSIFLMKRTLSSLFILLFLFVSYLYAGNNDIEIDKILSSAESLFKAMKENNYPKIWTNITDKSRELIINNVYIETKKRGNNYQNEVINKDFAEGGVLSASFWKQYLERFDPDWVLEESKWEMGKIQKDQAEVIVRYKRSVGPTTLKMSKEKGKWVVGLLETWKPLKPLEP